VCRGSTSSVRYRRPNHTVRTRALRAYLRWRNANARQPDVLAAQRRERTRIAARREPAGADAR
jgi:hypothetical protein